jgi:hypothetical protein
MGWKEASEIRRQSTIKKRGLVDRRDRDLKEAEALRRKNVKGVEDAHKAEVGKIRAWFNDEMQREAEYVADLIEGAQR